jgi:hypothetical protein
VKNPLTIFSKVRTTIDVTPLTEVVTLEFCYDHVNVDYPGFNLDELLLLQHDEFQPLGIQETE